MSAASAVPPHNISKIEDSLWEAADQLRANSKLTSSEYCMPVLGVIFLRHATNRYRGRAAIHSGRPGRGKMPQAPVGKGDFIKRRALMLPEGSPATTTCSSCRQGTNLGTALVEAMNAIEADFEPLATSCPRTTTASRTSCSKTCCATVRFSERCAHATGDVFGRIYEYFLMKFAMQGAQDNGEFFTPPSLVQTIVNVIEPDHGVVFDPPAAPAACSCSPATSSSTKGWTP
jgi:type I restriction enzyme M protein